MSHAWTANRQWGHDCREQQLEGETGRKQEGRTHHLADIKKETVESNGVVPKKKNVFIPAHYSMH